jgi:hypothetical protein
VALAPGSYALGPGAGSLRVLTFRDGVAARAGHDLVLEVGRWRAQLALGPAEGRLEATADPGSLIVLEGRGGVKPLGDRDRTEILRTIGAKVLRGLPLALVARVAAAGGAGVAHAGGARLELAGELEIAGRSRAVAARIGIDATGRATGSLALRQSDWGIKPYRGFMGALRLRDEVQLVLDAALVPA